MIYKAVGRLAFFAARLPCLWFDFLPPIPPTPFPGGEGGDFSVYFAGGFAPGTPALNRLRHLQSLPLWCPEGGLATGGTCYPCHCGTLRGGLPALPPAYPAFSLIFCPHPPDPPSRREGGDFLVYFAGGFAPGTPALNRLRHLQSLPRWYPVGACPRRHWLTLPRGRGPSQTPKFLSPGPPSPWLPALLTSAASQPPRHPWAPLTPAEPTTS